MTCLISIDRSNAATGLGRGISDLRTLTSNPLTRSDQAQEIRSYEMRQRPTTETERLKSRRRSPIRPYWLAIFSRRRPRVDAQISRQPTDSNLGLKRSSIG